MKIFLSNFVLFSSLLIIPVMRASIDTSISFESFIKNSENKDVSNYAKLNGFPNFDQLFNDFKINFKRNYTLEDEDKRKYYFMNTLINIEKNKQQLKNGEVFYELAINKFADITPEEKLEMGNNWSNHKSVSFAEQRNKNLHVSEVDNTQTLPQNFDWRDKNVVTDVKAQGNCGSCWAFAGIATIESAYAIKNNLITEDLIKLSEQEMVDCVFGKSYISTGCGGGAVYEVYQFSSNYGAVKEVDYPYRAKQGQCKLYGDVWKTKILDYYFLSEVSDDAIMHTIYNKGPVAVLINAGDDDFMGYGKGILTSIGNRNTDNDPNNHYITVVGWGTEKGIYYWIVKNSYGKDWGDKGYIKMKRGINIRGFNTLILYSSFKDNSNILKNSWILKFIILVPILFYSKFC